MKKIKTKTFFLHSNNNISERQKKKLQYINKMEYYIVMRILNYISTQQILIHLIMYNDGNQTQKIYTVLLYTFQNQANLIPSQNIGH